MLFPFFVSLIGLFFLLTNAIRFYYTRKNKDVLYRIISVYFIFLFIYELFCNITGFLHPNGNFFLSHYYFIIQFVILSVFFYKLFANPILKRIIVFFLIVVLGLLSIQYYNRPSIYWGFNLFEIGATSTLLIFYSVVFLTQNFKIGRHDYFYFCSGLIIYLTSSQSIFLTGNSDSVIFTEPFLLDFWFFNSLFYILYQYFIFKEWKVLNNKATVEELETIEVLEKG